MIIFDADDPLVLNGTYDREGYKPGERARIEKARRQQKELTMAKKGNRFDSKRANDTNPRISSHRVNTVKGNGAPSESREVAPAEVPIGEAMRLAIEALGPVAIDESLAADYLRELAEAYEHVAEEKTAYDRKAEAAKIAKKSYESATELLLEKVRTMTHPTPLPLFDQKQAEDDEKKMRAGGPVSEEANA